MARAFSRALLSAGNNMEARIAMMAITTSNSMRVKDFFFIANVLLGFLWTSGTPSEKADA